MTETTITPRGLTDKQAAAYAGVPLAAFRRAAQASGLRPVIIGGRKRYDRQAIDATFFGKDDRKSEAETADYWLKD